MKRTLLCCALSALAIATADRAAAQGYGLPVFDASVLGQEGCVDSTIGVNANARMQFLGARVTSHVQKGLRLFVDLGAILPEQGDLDMSMQGGVLATLRLDAPVDVAVRGTIYGLPGDEIDVIGATAMLLVGRDGLLFDGVTCYGGLGVNLSYAGIRAEPRIETVDGEPAVVIPPSTTDGQITVLLAGGVMVPLTKTIAFYGELDITDNVSLGVGLRMQ